MAAYTARGVMKQLHDNWEVISAGKADDDLKGKIEREVGRIGTSIDEVIETENNVTGAHSQGGSDHGSARELNTGMGALHNAAKASVSDNVRIANQLSSIYENLGKYPVEGIDGTSAEGKKYGNILETFLEKELIDRLAVQDDPTPFVSDKEPVFNYCGNVVSHREKIVEDQDRRKSLGAAPTAPSGEPGYNAGGLDTSLSSTELTAGGASGSAVVNNSVTHNFSSAVIFSLSEGAMVKSGAVTGQLVFRTDVKRMYLRTKEDTQSRFDFVEIGGHSGSDASGLSSLSSLDNIVGKEGQIKIEEQDNYEHRVSFADNAAFPGVRVGIPHNADDDANAPEGSFRYHPISKRLQVKAGASKWLSIVTGGGTSITGAKAASASGISTYDGTTDDGVVELRSIAASGLVAASESDGLITLTDNLTVANSGTGTGHVFKERSGNEIKLRTIAGGTGVDVSSVGDQITISTSGNANESDRADHE